MSSSVGLPRLAEALLAAVLPAALFDEVLGDLSERFRIAIAEKGVVEAQLWLWGEVLMGLPAFFLFSLQTESRRQTVNGSMFREGRTSAALSAILLIPAFLLVIPGLLFSFFGKPIEASLNALPGFARAAAWADQPWIVLGGLGLALLINLIAVANFKFEVLRDKFQLSLYSKRALGI